ncbi:fibronectin type III domain-containing protein [Candidatus Gracilibacteria bacterium]|nr:fibronectin type III domain-containing protein [Candidatus Gracilibacteria bacterium]MCF7819788.1 fibronectin type III domain-containing protein [Candidatus Gracilibacteria bacterium]
MKKIVFWFAAFLMAGGAFFSASAQDFFQPPEEVQNVSVVPGNQSLSIIWDGAEDPDGVVTGYKLYYGTSSVQTPDDTYDDEIVLGNVTEYTLTGLNNNTEYFVALTAIDDEGNESETYSVEVPATPYSENTNTEKPRVLAILQPSNSQVVVEMSEPVLLTNEADAFILEQADTFEEVPIQEITVEANNVILTFEEGALMPDHNYRVIATSAVEDLDGNPVSSGITDMIEFTAQYISSPPPLPEGIDSPVSPENFDTPEVEEPETQEPELPPEPPEEPTHSAPQETPPVDTVPPLDAQDLTIDTSRLESENIVLLRWEPAIDADGDIVDQILYTRKGLESWDNGYSLGRNVSELELEVDFNENYEIKLTTIDEAGNESQGVTLSFSTHLAQTGPAEVGTVIALAILFFLGLVILGKRRAAY